MDPVLVAAILASILTAPGASIAAGIVNRGVEYTKRFLPNTVNGREKWWALSYTVLLVTIAYAYGLAAIPPTQQLPWVEPLVLITLPLTVLSILRLSMAFADDLDKKPGTLTGPPA